MLKCHSFAIKHNLTYISVDPLPATSSLHSLTWSAAVAMLVQSLSSLCPTGCAVLNTLPADASASVFSAVFRRRLPFTAYPIVSFRLSERDIATIGAELMAGHYIVSSFFGTVDTREAEQLATAMAKANGWQTQDQRRQVVQTQTGDESGAVVQVHIPPDDSVAASTVVGHTTTVDPEPGSAPDANAALAQAIANSVYAFAAVDATESMEVGYAMIQWWRAAALAARTLDPEKVRLFAYTVNGVGVAPQGRLQLATTNHASKYLYIGQISTAGDVRVLYPSQVLAAC